MKSGALALAVLLPAAMLAFMDLGDDPTMTRMAAIAVMMSILWMTEAIPLAATALLPLALFPFLGITSSKAVAAQYMNSTVFLLIGGFLIALAMQRWELHKRIALTVLARCGSHPGWLLAGFGLASAGLSMWISNTATTLMMLPIALAIVARFEHEWSAEQIRRFSVGLLLMIAYSASIGGMMTLVGTAPNLVFARLYEAGQGVDIGFARWMAIGVPVGSVMLVLTVLCLGGVYIRGLPQAHNLKQRVQTEKDQLGIMRYEEKMVLWVFTLTAGLWVTRKGLTLGDLSIPGWSGWLTHGKLIDDGCVAIAMALLLFLIPVSRQTGRGTILDQSVFAQLPWSVVLLFGGGFALAFGFVESGLSAYLAGQLGGLQSVSRLTLVLAICSGMTFLTELTSNTATTQLVLPILQSLADAMQVSALWLMLPATLSASCAFMFPVATPPNAIVFGSGRIRVMDMVKTGLLLNLLGVIVIVALVYGLLPWVFAATDGFSFASGE